jgi:hypothetical protein
MQFLKVRRVEAFGEPTVDWREEIAGFAVLARGPQSRARPPDSWPRVTTGRLAGALGNKKSCRSQPSVEFFHNN